jgi:aspartokinase-like uncharacterized kinase
VLNVIVIKLGGSLSKSDTLLSCLNRIEQAYQGRAVVIVPGGGAFADQVRVAQQHWSFDDKTAHAMAILAMQQMAFLFKGLKRHFVIAQSVSAVRELLRQQKIVIWSPDNTELDNAGIAASWEITSDSLAAWLATRLLASELILVKAAAIDVNLSLHELAEQAVVDSTFGDFVEQAAFKVQIVNADVFAGGCLLSSKRGFDEASRMLLDLA